MLLAVLAAVGAFASSGYEVSVPTMVANPGQRVAVPIKFDTVCGVSHVGVRVAYDPQVLVFMKAVEGDLTKTLSDDYVVAGNEREGIVSVAAFARENVKPDVGGALATLVFAVRDGTQGHYSDVTITRVKLGDETGVRDITVGNPIRTVNGMVRVMPKDATVARLEGAQTICPDSEFASLVMKIGDGIQASDKQTGVRVSGEVIAEGPVTVEEPLNGWTSGRYVLLSARTTGLQFSLQNLNSASMVCGFETKDGMTTYYADLTVAEEIPVLCDDEALTPGAMNQIRANACLAFEGKTDSVSLSRKAMYESAKKIAVEGPKGAVGIIADMGISPAFVGLDETGTLHLSYSMPSLAITSFSPETGAVRFKVTPGEGNQIVSELATGYLHVYGTDNLGEKMRYISSVGFDLTPYLKADTRGEGLLHVELGTHSFLKIKVESVQKTEGQPE